MVEGKGAGRELRVSDDDHLVSTRSASRLGSLTYSATLLTNLLTNPNLVRLTRSRSGDHLVVCRRGCVRHDARRAVERPGTQDAHCAAGSGCEGLPARVRVRVGVGVRVRVRVGEAEGLPRGGTRVGLEGEPPGLPRYAVRLVRVPSTYSTRGPGGKPPCASGTTREAGTRSTYVPSGGREANASA